jgi:hypothetical protein
MDELPSPSVPDPAAEIGCKLMLLGLETGFGKVEHEDGVRIRGNWDGALR